MNKEGLKEVAAEQLQDELAMFEAAYDGLASWIDRIRHPELPSEVRRPGPRTQSTVTQLDRKIEAARHEGFYEFENPLAA